MTDSTLARAVLITIPLSHYCEKARWGLDRSEFPYREEPHAPLFHRLATRRNHGRTVPVLACGNQRFIDSTDILVHADATMGGNLLYPRDVALRREVDALEERFDTELGPHTRRWVYAHLMSQPALLRSVWSREASWFEASLLPLITPLVRRLVRRAYRITPEKAQHSLERVRAVFQEVDERLRDGRGFLVGDCFTAADLTFAALAAPVLFPAECRAAHPVLESVPSAKLNGTSSISQRSDFSPIAICALALNMLSGPVYRFMILNSQAGAAARSAGEVAEGVARCVVQVDRRGDQAGRAAEVSGTGASGVRARGDCFGLSDGGEAAQDSSARRRALRAFDRLLQV
jgi:glutathione S-transferase